MFDRDLSNSSKAFVNIVYPYLQKENRFFKNSILTSVENDNSSVSKILDMSCGIDWILTRGDINYTLATRVQVCGQSYNSFTIRCARDSGASTELDKRKKSIKLGATYPDLTIQAYLNKWDGDVIGFGMIKTVELYKYINRNFDNEMSILEAGVGGDSNSFLTVHWTRLIQHKYKVAIYPTNLKEQIGRDVIHNIDMAKKFDSFEFGLMADEVISEFDEK